LGFEKANGMGGKMFVPVSEIPFAKVINCFKKSILDEYVLNIQTKLATPINFISTLSKNPIILHFIGLGHLKDNVGKKEASIMLENEDGSGQFVTAQKLKMIVNVCNSRLEIVMIQTCYDTQRIPKTKISDDEAFKVFTIAGANHVIVYKKLISDDISLL
jgi:hypothetical protein